ncbi:MAG: hypothetical protein JXK07_15450, partial [Spirochaetes bacterium]|nr:hypothetical protein [Spirochaetota bacterium]MBN2769511.1 hypothetical protein [Spirochaetota bacterium]
ASLSLRESGDKHGTFSGCSPETVQIIARENCAIVWTMCFFFLQKILKKLFLFPDCIVTKRRQLPLSEYGYKIPVISK